MSQGSTRTSSSIVHTLPERKQSTRVRPSAGHNDPTSFTDRRVRKVVDLLGVDLRREVEIIELARSVNLSASRLCHIFTAEVGMPPTRYLKMLRLRRASELLKTTFLSVKEIAEQVGISDESHFVRDFGKLYGLTPARYRARRLDP